MEFVGARWWKFDLHNHTPASYDYGRGTPTLRETTLPRDWLLGYINAGIQCVAVTDHNSGNWIDKLKEAAQDLCLEGHEIYVFPGVEITANSNVHVLGIFDPETDGAYIGSVIGACGYRGKHGESDVADKTAESVVDEIIKFGGVAIMAHIDQLAGMCHIQSSTTIKNICEKVSAVEVVFPFGRSPDNDVSILRTYRGFGLDLPEITGSDAHHPSEIGRSFTWIKMSKPSIEGLRLALIDGQSSVVRSDAEKSDPNITSDTLIKKITIHNAKYCGRGSPFVVEFNPWLNSIIGGRGSGKSSLLEFLRIGCGRSNDLSALPKGSEVRESFERFAKISRSRDADGVLLSDTEIEVAIRKNGADYRLTWNNADPSVHIDKLVDSDWIREDGDAAARFPIKIFSQKQIFSFSKNPSTLLSLIDATPQVNIGAWKMLWEDAKNKFLRINAQRRELEAKLSQTSIIRGQILDLQQKIEMIEKSDHSLVFSELQTTSSKTTAVNSILKSTEAEISKIQAVLAATNINITVPPDFFPWNEPDYQVAEKLELLSKKITEAHNNMKGWANIASTALSEISNWLITSDFNKNSEVAQIKYRDLVATFQQSGVKHPEEYNHLIQARSKLQLQLAELDHLQHENEALKNQGDLIYHEMVKLRRNLTTLRKHFLESMINTPGASLNISIQPLCDDSDLDTQFREIIGKSDSTFIGDIYDTERSSGILFALNKRLTSESMSDPDFISDSAFTGLHDFKSQLFNYRTGKVLEETIGKKFIDFLGQLNGETFDRLVTWFPEDRLVVKYHDGNRMKDIALGSAGQKAATILSFLLSYGDEPLVLDQPEDDLDNKLISSLIVTKLQKNKAGRQIIIVTHNPNIVVNGDSEYVVALRCHGQMTILAEGSLQDRSVRNQVCEIMEGGEIALKQRYRRMTNI